MLKKYCPKCRQTSYSSCAEGTWICPVCTYNLTREPALPINCTGEWKIKLEGVKPEQLPNKVVRHLTLIQSR